MATGGRADRESGGRAAPRWILLVAAIVLALPIGCPGLRKSPPPRAPASLLDAGDLALANGQPEEAAQQFERALVLEPESPRALLGMARSRKALGDGSGALDYFSRYAAVETEAWSPRAIDDYCGALAMAAGQAIDADDPERGLRLGRRLPRSECREPRQREIVMRAQLGLAAKERAAGNPDRALAFYRAVLEEDSIEKSSSSARSAARGLDPRARDRLQARAYRGAAELLLAAGDRRQALEVLSEGVGRFPRDQELLELMVAVLAQSDE